MMYNEAMAGTEMQLPFRGVFKVTQQFGNGDNPAEPEGFQASDGSINYDGNGQPGRWHNGIDFGLPCGTPLLAACDGSVLESGTSPSGFGLRIMIKDSARNVALTGHMSRLDVKQGQRVAAGDAIGLSGNTGNSTGCHVHVSVIRPDGSYVDPLLVMGPAGPPPDLSGIRFESFSVVTQRDGITRVWDGPSSRLHTQATLQAGTSLLCDAWCMGSAHWDNAAKAWDRRWYHKSSGGWVPSARVYGNPPNSQP